MPPLLSAYAPFTCEFKTCQRWRTGIQIFRKRQHLKSTAQHFGMKQRLQFALRFARIR